MLSVTRRRAVDTAISVACGALICVGSYFAVAEQPTFRQLDALGWSLLVMGSVSVWFRRRWPRASWVVALGVTTFYFALNYGNGPLPLCLVPPLFEVGNCGVRRRSAVVGTVTVVVLAAAKALFGRDGLLSPAVVASPGWVTAALLLGHASLNRRVYVSSLEERARSAEATREDEARRRVGEERLRIARDIHDVVGHSLVAITVQAGVAAHVLAERPDEAQRSLSEIKQISREALREIKETLNVLRDPGESEPLRPAAGMVQLDALVSATTGAGVATDVRVTGIPRTLPPAVDLSAFRIIQESLTNVVRHAGPATVSVKIDYGPNILSLEIVDTGRQSGLDDSTRMDEGNGIRGMRERAAAVGGQLEAAPCQAGGFRVRAHLPAGADQ